MTDEPEAMFNELAARAEAGAGRMDDQVGRKQQRDQLAAEPVVFRRRFIDCS